MSGKLVAIVTDDISKTITECLSVVSLHKVQVMPVTDFNYWHSKLQKMFLEHIKEIVAIIDKPLLLIVNVPKETFGNADHLISLSHYVFNAKDGRVVKSTWVAGEYGIVGSAIPLAEFLEIVTGGKLND